MPWPVEPLPIPVVPPRVSLPGFIERPLRALWDRPANQLPPLDALRSLAILVVLIGHAAGSHVKVAGQGNDFVALPFVRGGFIGVDLFFVLSGYFIGRQLWREAERTGGVAFGRFFARRALRIWPLYGFFIFFTLVVLGRGDFSRGRWWSDAAFLTNYVNQGVVMGSWSLCIEEQFYLLAPLGVGLAYWWVRRRSSGHASTGRGALATARLVLIALFIGLPLLRAFLWLRYAGSLQAHSTLIYKWHLYQPFHTHADGLVMGLLLANAELDRGKAGKRGILSHGGAVLCALLACVLLKHAQREVLGFTAITLLFGSVTWYLICRGEARPRVLRLLDSRVFYVLSRLSFGMYLNHAYLTEPIARATLVALPFHDRLPALHGLTTALVVAVASALLAVVTFALIEHPFLALRLGSGHEPADRLAFARRMSAVHASNLSSSREVCDGQAAQADPCHAIDASTEPRAAGAVA